MLVSLALTIAPVALAGQKTDPSDQAKPSQQESKSTYEEQPLMGGTHAVGGQLVMENQGCSVHLSGIQAVMKA